MIRTRALVLCLAMAGAGTIGCTFCDTCDDFPIPVVGGAGYAGVGGPPAMGVPIEGSFTTVPGGAPGEGAAPPAGTTSPFAAPGSTGDVQGDTVPPQIPRPEANEEESSEMTPPAPAAPQPESDVPVTGTAVESLPGTDLPTTPTLPDPAAPAAPTTAPAPPGTP